MGSHLIVSSVQPTLRQKVIVAHHNDPYLVEKRHLAERGEADEFSISLMMGFFLEAFICASSSAVKTELLIEAHSSLFSKDPCSTKMYNDLKLVFWWQKMKGEVTYFVSTCFVCQHVKA